jgi:hypothetical protein
MHGQGLGAPTVQRTGLTVEPFETALSPPHATRTDESAAAEITARMSNPPPSEPRPPY